MDVAGGETEGRVMEGQVKEARGGPKGRIGPCRCVAAEMSWYMASCGVRQGSRSRQLLSIGILQVTCSRSGHVLAVNQRGPGSSSASQCVMRLRARCQGKTTKRIQKMWVLCIAALIQ
jgi:hypothetical protein